MAEGAARQAGSKLTLMRMAAALARIRCHIRPVLHARALRKATHFFKLASEMFGIYRGT